MNFRPAILTFVLFTCSILSAIGQCDVSISTIIEDVSSGSVDIFVEGASNNNLSNADQGLCGVELFFEHTSIQDISISLQSPAGQQVTLVGPATGAGGNTQFTYWGVEFVPCDSSSTPDLPILDEIFTTEDNWGIFGNYSGQYYPQQGCLEDFNTGTVNGLWTLNFEDVQNFDIGSIDSIALIFCDDTDLTCQECLANGGMLSGASLDFCESDPDLNLDIEPVFDAEEPSDDYIYNYLIIQESEVIQTVPEPDLTNYPFGSYQVCGLSSLQSQSEDILEDVIGSEFDALLSLFSSNNYCAGLSSNCIAINIIEVPDTILTIDTICTGDAIILDGNAYTETGEYVISFSEAFCDSVSILDLLVIDNQAVIEADSDVISCSDGDVLLDASNSITSSSTIRSWFKVDGFIDPSVSSNISITVTEAGVYGLSLISGICADTVYYEIVNDDSIPSFTFDVDTITCYNPSLVLDMTPSIPLQSVSWTGPLSSNDEDITVSLGGIYFVEGVAINGCLGSDSIRVYENVFVPTPIIIGDTLNCVQDSASISLILPDSLDYVFDWTGPNIVDVQNEGQNIKVTQDTTYILSLENIENGCFENFSFDVVIDTNRTNFLIESTLIDCNNTQSEVTVEPMINSASYEWTFEDENILVEGSTIEVDQDGEYTLVTTTSNGCVDTFSHVVVRDSILPIVNVDDVTISCSMDSVQFITTTTETDLTFLWSGPNGFMSTEASPYVVDPGEYVLRSIPPSGCRSLNYVRVIPGDDLPNLTFSIDTLKCNVDVISLTPSDTTNLSFLWQTPSITLDSTSTSIEVDQAGIYQVVVTDTIGGCSIMYDVLARGNYDIPIAEVEQVSLDCIDDMVMLNTTFAIPIESVTWSSDNGFESFEISPTVTEVGDYYISVVGANGCLFNDTITVSANVNLPVITPEIPLLDCLNESVEISFSTNNESDILEMQLPNGNIVSQSILVVNEPATYIAIATSLSGCVDSLEMVVQQDTLPFNSFVSSNGQIDCADSTVTIYVADQEEGLIYNWTGNSILTSTDLDSIVVDSQGVYSVEVTDSSNCVVTLDFEVVISKDPPIVTIDFDSLNCTKNFADISLDVPANFKSIVWEGPEEIDNDLLNVTVATTGIYFVSVTGENNCKTIDTVIIEIDTIPAVIDIISTGVITCAEDSVLVSGVADIPNSNFVWMDEEGTTFDGASLQVTSPGTYSFSVTSPNTCQIDSFIIIEIDTLQPTITTGPEPAFSCSDGKVILEIETTTNVVEYAWEGPMDFESDLDAPLAVSAGLYTVTVTNEQGCTSSIEINVLDDTEGPEIMVRDTFITCDQMAVPLPLETSEIDITFGWDAAGFSSDLQNPETNVVGQYIVYAVLERNECVTVDTVNVTYQEVPPVYEIITEDINCNQSEVTLKTSDTDDDVSVTWTDYNFNFISLDSLTTTQVDSFQLIIVGSNACIDTSLVVVKEDFEEVEIDILFEDQVLCDNTEVTLAANLDAIDNSIFSATWSTQEGNIISGQQSLDARIDGEGTYVISVINNVNGCESVDSIELSISPDVLMGISLEGNDPNCLGFEDGNISVLDIDGGIAPFQYALNGNLQSEPNFSDLPVGNYTIQVIDDLGCTIEMDYILNEGLDFIVTAELDTTIVVGDEIDLISIFNTPDEEIANIVWTSDRDDYSCDDCFEAPVSPLFNTTYTLEATTINGCSDTSQVLIRVIRNPKIEVANVFAPGSDENGLFFIQQTSGIEKVLSISVFDKWASRMFLAENINPGDPAGAWDGTYLGRDVNPGVYVVVAELLLYTGEVVTFAGDITLLR